MKNPIFVLLLSGTLLLCDAQGKYSTLILDDGIPIVRNDQLYPQVLRNCTELCSLSAWNGDLTKYNRDQCKLCADYSDFSKSQLNWIDEVKLETQFDATAGMEVEVIRFYDNGREVEPKSFLSSRLEKCKELQSKQEILGCKQHMAELLLECKNLLDQTNRLQESSRQLIMGMQSKLTDEIDELKGSRNPLDIRKVKEKKNHMFSVKLTLENALILLPGLLKDINKDYAKITAVSNTLHKLEKGL